MVVLTVLAQRTGLYLWTKISQVAKSSSIWMRLSASGTMSLAFANARFAAIQIAQFNYPVITSF